MAITVADLESWLSELKPDDLVAIDDSGLILVALSGPPHYIKIGGIPACCCDDIPRPRYCPDHGEIEYFTDGGWRDERLRTLD